MAFVWHAYMRQLRTNTLRTQMATSFVIMGLGDVITQQVVRKKGWEKHEWTSTLRFSAYGCFLFTPLANRWHYLMNRINLSTLFRTTATRLAIDLTCFSPAATTWFFLCMGLMEGRSLEEIRQRLGKNFTRVVTKQWMVFGPAQALNMSVIPVYARPPFLNIVGLAWSSYLASISAEMNESSLIEQQRIRETDRISAAVME